MKDLNPLHAEEGIESAGFYVIRSSAGTTIPTILEKVATLLMLICMSWACSELHPLKLRTGIWKVRGRLD